VTPTLVTPLAVAVTLSTNTGDVAAICSGEMERLQRFWMAGACKKNEAKGETSKPLGVLNFTSAFILLTSGMLLSVALLLLEHLYFAFFRAKLRKCDTVGCCSLVSLVCASC